MSNRKPAVVTGQNPDLRALGRRLREVRGFEMNQKQMADELRISQSQLSKYERGVAAPPADVLFLIKRKFRISIDWLLTGDR
jgi:transcriptional regulator with XRE-family HTH domain